MGTDIHGVWQRRSKTAPATTKETNLQSWEDIESRYTQDRHYQLFAALAGVRNGSGFAGVITGEPGEPVKPVSDPRGLPNDFYMVDDAHPTADIKFMDSRRMGYHTADYPKEIWMGDHSHSWLTGEEMLEWYDDAPTVTKIGILSRSEYETWDKESPPDCYCGGISGPNVVLINDSEIAKESVPDWTHIRCDWDTKLWDELKYFFDEVKRLQYLHGEIRFVFGFDS